jgi:acyl-CoA-binding protein
MSIHFSFMSPSSNSNFFSWTPIVLVFASLAILYTGTYLMHWDRSARVVRKKESDSDDQCHARGENDDSVDTVFRVLFEKAIALSSSLEDLTDDDKLLLYGLYKQATVGDAPETGSSFTMNIQANFKRSAWNKFRGMPQTTAMFHYIQAVEELAHYDEEDDLPEERTIKSSNQTSSGCMGQQPSVPMDDDDQDIQCDQDSSSLDTTFLRTIANAAASTNASATTTIGNDVLTQMQHYLDLGANLHSADDQGITALHLCADRGFIEGVKLLLHRGANPNATDHDGITVLHTAVMAGHTEICQVLLEAGADPDQEDEDGESPRLWAQEEDQENKDDSNSPNGLAELFTKYPKR